MGQTEKAAHYAELKAAGVDFDRHYREYTEIELANAVTHLRAAEATPNDGYGEQPSADQQLAEAFFGVQATAPVAHRDEREMAGQRQNTQEIWEPIRTDPETGYIWYQEEVKKLGYAAPRGRRVLRTEDAAVVTQTVQNGQFTESFEVAGDGPKQATEIKVTLPSYQTGIYKHPSFPFKIHVYNGNQGFDFEEVAAFYGDVDLVPDEIKRVYVENDLCWDIRTTIRAIEAEDRRLQLQAAGVNQGAHRV